MFLGKEVGTKCDFWNKNQLYMSAYGRLSLITVDPKAGNDFGRLYSRSTICNER